MEENRSAFKISRVTPSGKRPLGRRRCRGKDNIRMNLKETGIHYEELGLFDSG